MFANRFTALVDACCLAGALKRNLLLTLAEAAFYRIRWSTSILDETEEAVVQILAKRGEADAVDRAAYMRSQMELAFEEAAIENYEDFLPSAQGLPDPDDAHVLAAALKAQANVIVTDNIKDFPAATLQPLGIVAITADEFLANTIALNEGAAVAAIHQKRASFERPELSAEVLLLRMEAVELTITAGLLKDFADLL